MKFVMTKPKPEPGLGELQFWVIPEVFNLWSYEPLWRQHKTFCEKDLLVVAVYNVSGLLGEFH